MSDKDPEGWTPLQLALKTLRPGVVLEILDSKPELETELLCPDPKGLMALHRIATQILHENVPVPQEERNIVPRLRQPNDFAENCILLWDRCLSVGIDINIPDRTEDGNPPIFHYFTQFHMNSRGTYYTTLHFPRLFQSEDNPVDLSAVNARGDLLLHAVVRKCDPFHDYEASSVVKYLVQQLQLNPLVEDKDGLTVMDIAAKKRLPRIGAIFQTSER